MRNNTASNTGSEVCNGHSNPQTTFAYCNLQDPFSDAAFAVETGSIIYAGSNIDADPCFIDPNSPTGADNIFATADDGFCPASGPCIDAGGNILAENIPQDITAGIRIRDYLKNDPQPTIDIGPYELTTTWFVDAGDGNDITGSGTTENPFKTLDALVTPASAKITPGDTVRIRPGTYKSLNSDQQEIYKYNWKSTPARTSSAAISRTYNS